VRDYDRWLEHSENLAERSRIFGVPDKVRTELIAGMANGVDRDIFNRERGYNNDLTVLCGATYTMCMAYLAEIKPASSRNGTADYKPS